MPAVTLNEEAPLTPNSAAETSPLFRSARQSLPLGAAPMSTVASDRSSGSSSDVNNSSIENAQQSSSSHQPLRSRESSASNVNLMDARFTRASGTFDDLVPEVLHVANAHSGEGYSRYSSISRRNSSGVGLSGFADPSDDVEMGIHDRHRSSFFDSPTSRNSVASYSQTEMVNASTTDALLWDEKNSETDDYLHNPGQEEYKGRLAPPGAIPVLKDQEKLGESKFRPFSVRGLANVFVLIVVCGGLIGIFAFWPIATYVEELRNRVPLAGWNIGGVNASGQVPEIQGFPQMIDADTPNDVKNYKGSDGKDYVLVFSDEFNQDGRTFWPGDDPFWEAVDLNYWATVNYEWCDPDAVTTKDGNLEITMTEQPIHGLNFRSGFLQSWNKFCFNKDAYIEVNLSLPGDAEAIGLWPGIWTMGNLGRAGFGATNDGMWPYSYDSCDVGTMPNQTTADGQGPDAARTSGSKDYGGSLSYLPGQKLSACTCRGDDHPGPSHGTGRGAPEIDILEAQVDYHGYGTASQSVQIAPFDAGYYWDNSSAGWTQHNTNTTLNLWKGSITQESASAVTILDATSYDGAGYQTFGYELQSGGEDGFITWTVGGRPTWTLHGAAFKPNEGTGVGQRIIGSEPMYILLNLFISSKFQGNPDFGKLRFPATLRIDYVRVYQPKGHTNIGCDPEDKPTAKYIQDHLAAYLNPNATTWEQAGYEWPRNSMAEGGCSTDRAGP